MDPEKAMDQGCKDHFPLVNKEGVCGTGDSADADRCCNSPEGYGAGYPPKIFKYLADACAQAGGTVSTTPPVPKQIVPPVEPPPKVPPKVLPPPVTPPTKPPPPVVTPPEVTPPPTVTPPPPTGRWIGPYSDTETYTGTKAGPHLGETLPFTCVNSNSGTLTMMGHITGDSFTATVDETGSSVPASGSEETCEGGQFHYTGTARATISGNQITGTITLSDAQSSYVTHFSGTIDGDNMTSTYTGTGNFGEGSSSTYSGSFDLKES